MGISGSWYMGLLKTGFRDNHPKTLGFKDSNIQEIWDLAILTTGFGISHLNFVISNLIERDLAIHMNALQFNLRPGFGIC